jgi:hypothetical protein
MHKSRHYVTQTEQEDGLFRFGRRLEEGEKILYREKDVETQFTQALTEARRLFSCRDLARTRCPYRERRKNWGAHLSIMK